MLRNLLAFYFICNLGYLFAGDVFISLDGINSKYNNSKSFTTGASLAYYNPFLFRGLNLGAGISYSKNNYGSNIDLGKQHNIIISDSKQITNNDFRLFLGLSYYKHINPNFILLLEGRTYFESISDVKYYETSVKTGETTLLDGTKKDLFEISQRGRIQKGIGYQIGLGLIFYTNYAISYSYLIDDVNNYMYKKDIGDVVSSSKYYSNKISLSYIYIF